VWWENITFNDVHYFCEVDISKEVKVSSFIKNNQTKKESIAKALSQQFYLK
jgi:hypothetical protein